MTLLSRCDPYAFPLKERIRQPDELSIFEIAVLETDGNESTVYADDERDVVIRLLVDACRREELPCYGDLNGWKVPSENRTDGNPFPGTERHYQPSMMLYSTTLETYCGNVDFPPEACVIEKADYRRWLESNGLPLPSWWFTPEERQEAGRKKGAAVANEQWTEAAKQARIDAEREWQAEQREGRPITKCGPMAQRLIDSDRWEAWGLHEPPDPDTVAKWIQPTAPKEATRPGRPKKPR